MTAFSLGLYDIILLAKERLGSIIMDDSRTAETNKNSQKSSLLHSVLEKLREEEGIEYSENLCLLINDIERLHYGFFHDISYAGEEERHRISEKYFMELVFIGKTDSSNSHSDLNLKNRIGSLSFLSYHYNGILVEMQKALWDEIIGDSSYLQSISIDKRKPYTELSQENIPLFGDLYFALNNMVWENQLTYCLFLYYDQLLAYRQRYKSFFSQKFYDMIHSDLRDPDTKRARSFAENEYFRSDDDTRRNNGKRNYSMFTKERYPQDTSPKNLIFTYYNAIEMLTCKDNCQPIGYGKELHALHWESQYIEWRLRVDTAWRLYFVLISFFDAKDLLNNKDDYFAIDDSDDDNFYKSLWSAVDMIAHVQDTPVRMMLINIFYMFTKRNLYDIKHLMGQLEAQFCYFLTFELEWEKLKKWIFCENDCCKMVRMMMNEPIPMNMGTKINASLMWIVEDECIYPLRTLMRFRQTDRIRSLIKEKEEAHNELTPEEELLKEETAFKSPIELDTKYVEQRNRLDEFLSNDLKSMNEDHNLKLFKKLWEMCFEQVPKIKAQ